MGLAVLNFFFHGDTLFIWVHLGIAIAVVMCIYLITKGKYIMSSTVSLFVLLTFNIIHMLKGAISETSEMIIHPMSDIVLTLLLGFIFIGFIAFKKWQLYVYTTFSLLFLTTYYLSIIVTRNSSLVPQEIHFIIIDYLIVTLSGGIGVFLNFNLTSRLMLIEAQRTKQLNAYNDNLELLIFDRTNDLDQKNQELEEKNKILAEQQKRIIRAGKVKEEFLSSVSHELRTPLNAVVGMTDILIKNDPEDNQQKNLNTLKSSTNSLLRIIDDLLDVSKIEGDKFKFKKEPFHIYEVLDSIHEVYRANASIKKLDFNYSISSRLPNQIIGDSVRLNQILSNLLSNGIKFTEEGTLDFDIIALREDHNEITIKFTVKDTGLGILREDQQKIFEKYNQLNEGKIAGTGLGLSIVKQMVNSLGGEITLKSTFGLGSEFSVILTYPIYREETLSVEEETVSLIDLKILLVEDNLLNQMVAKELLSIQKPEVTTANNGLEAVELCELMKFDLILMDIQMPIMDGLQATSIIREEGQNRETPIVALTANITDVAKKETVDVGMNGFVGKPFNVDFLFSEIQRVLLHV